MSGFEEKVLSSLETLTNRFDGLENRFDGLEKRFDGLENRFDGLEKRFDGLEKRFDGLENRFDEMKEYMEDEFRMVRVEIQHESDENRKLIEKLDERVGNLESIANERWNVNDYIARLQAVETVTTIHSGQIKKNTEQIENLKSLQPQVN